MNRRIEVTGYGEPLKVVEREIPTAPPGGLVVKTEFCGVCHSDLHIWEAEMSPLFTFPRVLGHEIAGAVHSISPEALEAYPELSEGSSVVVYPWVGCNNCNTCNDDNQYCPATVGFAPTNPKTNYTVGAFMDGGMQEYMVVQNAGQAIPVSGLPTDVAALCCCSGVTAYNAVTALKESVETAIKNKGSATVLQVGAGGLSLWACQINKAIYGDKVKVAVVDINESKMADAKDAGADVTAVWNPKDPAEAGIGVIREACGGCVDGVIDFTGLTATAERVFYCLNPGATWAVVGIFGGLMPQLPLLALTLHGIRIQGVYVGTRSQVKAVVDLVKDGKIKPPPIEHVKLDDVTDVFGKLKTGKQKGRAVIKF